MTPSFEPATAPARLAGTHDPGDGPAACIASLKLFDEVEMGALRARSPRRSEGMAVARATGYRALQRQAELEAATF
jgi:hypothetical protein